MPVISTLQSRLGSHFRFKLRNVGYCCLFRLFSINCSMSKTAPVVSVSKRKRSRKRQTVQVVGWVSPQLRAELERLASVEHVSLSRLVATLLAEAVRQKLHVQHAVLLQPIIETTLQREMRRYTTRLALLLVRCLFASEQTRSLVTNLLRRQPGVTQPVLEEILDGSARAAKRNLTRKTPQLETIIDEFAAWFQEPSQTGQEGSQTSQEDET